MGLKRRAEKFYYWLSPATLYHLPQAEAILLSLPLDYAWQRQNLCWVNACSQHHLWSWSLFNGPLSLLVNLSSPTFIFPGHTASLLKTSWPLRVVSKSPDIPASSLLFQCPLPPIKAVFKEKTQKTEPLSPLPEYSHHLSPGSVLAVDMWPWPQGAAGGGGRGGGKGDSSYMKTLALETCF